MTVVAREEALIALGSNRAGRNGPPADEIRAALARLEALARGPVRCSSLWRSRPVDCPPGSPDFVNACVAMTPRADSATALLGQLQDIEREAGGKPPPGSNAPRTLDLDLIAWGDRRSATATLTLPHPRALRRAFVLVPLAEIVPGQIFPGQEETMTDLAARCAGAGALQRL